MESKVSLYNSNDVKIGETFLRRARQLVRRQRATWVDDSQVAIRFAPGMEYMDDATVEHETEAPEKAPDTVAVSAPSPVGDVPVDWMMPIVEKRMRERRRFVVHTFIFIPVLVLLNYLFFFYFVVPLFAWVTIYAIHAYLHITNKFARRRIARRLAMDAALLRGEQRKS